MYEDFGAAVRGEEVEFRLFLPDNRGDPGQYERGGSPRTQTPVSGIADSGHTARVWRSALTAANG